MAMGLLGSRWWVFVLRGVLSVFFGVAVFLVPGLALLTLVVLFGLYALTGGIVSLAGALERSEANPHPRWALGLYGVVSLLAGIAAFTMPRVTALSLLYLIAAWAIVTGVVDVLAAIRLRKVLRDEWLYVLSGALSILFGVVVLAFPGAGALAVALWIGAWAFAEGLLLVALGLKLRRGTHRGERGFREVATSH